MPTTLHLDATHPADIARAADILRRGGLVAMPTETVYGLAANALDPDAVAGIFAAKQRPSWDPLIVHLPHTDAIPSIAAIPAALAPRVHTLAKSFWPGPLTLLLPRSLAIPDAVTAGRALVGVRIPAHPVTLSLLRHTGLPLAAPSANRFGHTSPTTAQHVLDDLDGRIHAVLDAGPCRVGVESTVLDPASTPMVIYRAGAIIAQHLEAIGLPAVLYQAPTPGPQSQSLPIEALPSPGVGIRHYAPAIPVHLTGPDQPALLEAVRRTLAAGLRPGILLPTNWSSNFADAPPQSIHIQPWASWDDPAALAAHLFAGLRALEHASIARAPIDCILCPLPPAGDVRDALRDRLTKAARSD